MNYSIFESAEMETVEGESEQEKMERVIRTVTGADVPSEEEKLRLNDRLRPEFSSCSFDEKRLTLKYRVRDWMLNPGDTVHGGILTTACDLTMGMTVRYFRKCRTVVTAQLSMDFMGNIGDGGEFLVRAKAEKIGRRTVFTSADVIDAETGKPMAKATAIFM